jgi:hypothetical protein
MPSSSAGIIQCHQVVLVVELVEASLFPHVWVWHVWPMHQVVPVVELAKRSSQHSFHIVWQKDNGHFADQWLHK